MTRKHANDSASLSRRKKIKLACSKLCTVRTRRQNYKRSYEHDAHALKNTHKHLLAQ